MIGNADGTDSIGDSYERQVGLAAGRPDGVVPDGSLGKDLLMADPAQPFGVRLDPEVVDERFQTAWSRARPPRRRQAAWSSWRPRTWRGRFATARSSTSTATAELWEESLAARPTSCSAGCSSRSTSTTDTVHGRRRRTTERGDRDLTVAALRGPGHRARLPPLGLDPAGRLPDPGRRRPRPSSTRSASPARSTWRAARPSIVALGRHGRRAGRPPHVARTRLAVPRAAPHADHHRARG